jgi:hypothetical protein
MSIRDMSIRDMSIRDMCTRDTCTRDICIQDTCIRGTRIRDTSGGMDILAGTDTGRTGVADDMSDHTVVQRGRRGDGHMAAGKEDGATGADNSCTGHDDVVNFERDFEPDDDVVDYLMRWMAITAVLDRAIQSARHR